MLGYLPKTSCMTMFVNVLVVSMKNSVAGDRKPAVYPFWHAEWLYGVDSHDCTDRVQVFQ